MKFHNLIMSKGCLTSQVLMILPSLKQTLTRVTYIQKTLHRMMQRFLYREWFGYRTNTL